jgi:peptidoglycan/LPS O-acetylase OafA/YrhL
MNAASYEAYGSSGAYHHALDGLRAIWVFLIVSSHMKDASWGWMSGGYAVLAFFVLSGYLITALALREEASGGFRLGAYCVRRLFRICPSYYFVLALYCALLLPWHFGFAVQRKQALLNALPYYVTYMNEFAPPGPFYQSWALGIEAKFYVVWPLLAFWTLSRFPRWRLLGTLYLVAVCRIAYSLWGLNWLNWYSSILIGCLLALGLQNKRVFCHLRIVRGRFASMGAVVAFFGCQFGMSVFGESVRHLYPWAVAWLICVLVAGDPLCSRMLGWKYLALIGKRSYMVYLIHLIAINGAVRVLGSPPEGGGVLTRLAALGLASGLSLVIAEPLYRLVERPAGNLGRLLSNKLLLRASTGRPECP